MNMVLFQHPEFLGSQSMTRFAAMIVRGMRARGHSVEVWMPRPFFYRFPLGKGLRKWLGYLDQFMVFPQQVRARLKKVPIDTLFVFSDQALGPWVPLVADRPHVIHVHDLLAMRSALGEWPQNKTKWTGRQYQAMIRKGFCQGKNFISVSENTRKNLQRFLSARPLCSEVVYNGLNFPFRPMSQTESAALLSEAKLSPPPEGFLLHVGGNQWYKNRSGVLEIYEAYARKTKNPLELWLLGAKPVSALEAIVRRLPANGKVRFLTGLSNEQVCAAYASARLLIYPSLAEGFGWPIAEAMACGCLVLTTDQAPMTEVGGDAAFYIPQRPVEKSEAWAERSAKQVMDILALSTEERDRRRQQGLRQADLFDTGKALESYEKIYYRALESKGVAR